MQRLLFLIVAFATVLSSDLFAGKRYWVGNGSSFNWNNTSNWSTSSGGAGGATLPGINDTVYFDSGRKCLINIYANVRRIEMLSTFSDSIVQNKNSIRVESGGFSIAGGKFLGDSTDIIILGTFNMTGGLFRSTQSLLYLVTSSFNYSSGTFEPNNGIVRFENNCTITGSLTFSSLRFTATSSLNNRTMTISSGTILTVNKILSITGTGGVTINTGTIYAKGDIQLSNTSSAGAGTATVRIVGTDDQVFTGSGIAGTSKIPLVIVDKPSGTLTLASIISVNGGWQYVRGLVNASSNSSTVVMHSNSTVSCQGTSEQMQFHHFRVSTLTTTLSGILKVAGDLTISFGRTLASAGYTVEVGGNWDNSGTFTASTGTVILNGVSSQQITGTATSTFNDLTLSGSKKNVAKSFVVNGTLNLGSSSLALDTCRVTINNASSSSITSTTGYYNTSTNGYIGRKTNSITAYAFPLGFTVNDSLDGFKGLITPGLSTNQYFRVGSYNSNKGITFSYDKAFYGTTASTIKFNIVNPAYDTLKTEVDINTSGNISAFRVYNSNTGAFEAMPSSAYTLSGNIIQVSDLYPLLIGYGIVKKNNDRNWVYTVEYGQGNVAVSEKMQYLDFLGRDDQQLARNIDQNLIIASQTIYDEYGKVVLQTLPAPTSSSLGYKSSFITAGGSTYRYTHFDVATTLNNPTAIDSTISGSLGKYYSHNGTESFVPMSSYPYVRNEYTADPMRRAKRATKPGNETKMGSGHEDSFYSMTAGDELKSVFGTSKSYKVETQTDKLSNVSVTTSNPIVATKSFTIDADGNVSVVYTKSDKVIAKCYSGKSNYSSIPTVSTMQYAGTHATDIHVPNRYKANLSLPLPKYYTNPASKTAISAGDITYTITDLTTNQVLKEYPTAGYDYKIESGRTITFYNSYASTTKPLFLRISFSFSSSLESFLVAGGYSIEDPTISYMLDYSNWTLSFYDLGGRMRKEVPPKGVDLANPGVYSMASTLDYNPLGQVIGSRKPDEGKVEFVYDNEGKIRFSRDDVQAAANKFNYTAYDSEGRVTETGLYTTDVTGGVYFQNYYNTLSSPCSGACLGTEQIVNELNGLDETNSSERSFVTYNKVESSDEIPSTYTYVSSYAQKNLMGRIAKTWNSENATWYSYDQFGNPMFIVQQLLNNEFTTGVDNRIKTLDYTYDPYTLLPTQKVYQNNVTSEKVRHELLYNAALQLKEVKIGIGSATPTTQAKFYYYNTGALKRKELGNGLQGLDYIYTITGKLKAINNPDLIKANDPGKDGVVGTTNASFPEDLFGLSLDYFYKDYHKANSSVYSSVSSGAGHYNGLIDAVRFKVLAVTNSVDNKAEYIVRPGIGDLKIINGTTEQIMNKYTYDEIQQLSTSVFGIYNSSTKSFSTSLVGNSYKEGGASSGGIGYDLNGNITSLSRYSYKGTTSDRLIDDLTYTYTSNTNKLSGVYDEMNSSTYSDDYDAALGSSYSYNSIGQLTASSNENISEIKYDHTGKVTKVTFTTGNNSYSEYYYNERGVKVRTRYVDMTNNKAKVTWYITDLSGAIQAIHEKDENISSTVTLQEQPLYAGGRLGTYYNGTAKINYEITDHLGNVRVTFEKISATVVQITNRKDYYAFGGLLPGRGYSNTTYRYNYQGQENAVNSSTWDNFELRMFNTSIGRWMSPDPYAQFHSPYNGMGNNPVSNTDPTGGFIKTNPDGSFIAGGKIYRSYGEYLMQGFFREWELFSAKIASEEDQCLNPEGVYKGGDPFRSAEYAWAQMEEKAYARMDALAVKRADILIQKAMNNKDIKMDYTYYMKHGVPWALNEYVKFESEKLRREKDTKAKDANGNDRVYYAKKDISVKESAIRIIKIEGLGAGGSFTVHLAGRVENNEDNSKLVLGASGQTAASMVGKIEFSGTATVTVDNKVYSQAQFNMPSGSVISSKDEIPIGNISMFLPSNPTGNVRVDFSFNYQLVIPEGRSGPNFPLNFSFNLEWYKNEF